MEKQEAERSHLFLVRIWLEELGQDEQEWRGRAQNIATGEALYFRGWTGLVTVLQEMAHAKREGMERIVPGTD